MIGAFTIVYCPFCAYGEKLHIFRMKKKRGLSSKRFLCPDCKQLMIRRTLLREFTIEQWARWLYCSIRIFKYRDNPEKDFYNRISWEKLWNRLRLKGWDGRFKVAWDDIKERYMSLTPMSIEAIMIQGRADMKPKTRLNKWLGIDLNMVVHQTRR